LFNRTSQYEKTCLNNVTAKPTDKVFVHVKEKKVVFFKEDEKKSFVGSRLNDSALEGQHIFDVRIKVSQCVVEVKCVGLPGKKKGKKRKECEILSVIN